MYINREVMGCEHFRQKYIVRRGGLWSSEF